MKTNHDYIPCAGCGAQLEETNCRYCGRESEYVFWTQEKYDDETKKMLSVPGIFEVNSKSINTHYLSYWGKEVVLKL